MASAKTGISYSGYIRAVGRPRPCWTLRVSSELDVSSQARFKRCTEGVATLWDVLTVESRAHSQYISESFKSFCVNEAHSELSLAFAGISHVDRPSNGGRNYSTLTRVHSRSGVDKALAQEE